MSHFQAIYRAQAAEYDALVSAEDADHDLQRWLRESTGELRGQLALELGVGTGRVTRWLLRQGAHVRGYEQSSAMLAVARERLAADNLDASDLHQGDAYALDAGEDWASLAIAGWVFGHAVEWHPDDWSERVDQALSTMRRALRPGGTLVVIETLGTGVSEPTPPPSLVPYLERLEQVHGLTRHAVRTDYAFTSPAEAERLTRFFFGDEMGDRVKASGDSRVPECTGVWSRRV